jgi:hypothetical protein
MPCGMYGALPAAGCGVMGMTGGGGSGVSTLRGATSLELKLGVTLGDGTRLGLIHCERRGEVEGELTGLWTGWGGNGFGLVGCCWIVLPIVVGRSDGGAVGGAGRVGSAAEKISESWRSACSCAVPICLHGAAGAGCCSAWDSSNAAILARSFDDVRGIDNVAGNNLTVSTIRVPFVFFICT